MNQELYPTRHRVEELERQVRVMRSLTIVVVVLLAGVALMPGSHAQQAAGTLRIRQLVVEDAEGRSRLVLGYLDAPGNLRRFGMRLDDPQGAERFWGGVYGEWRDGHGVRRTTRNR